MKRQASKSKNGTTRATYQPAAQQAPSSAAARGGEFSVNDSPAQLKLNRVNDFAIGSEISIQRNTPKNSDSDSDPWEQFESGAASQSPEAQAAALKELQAEEADARYELEGDESKIRRAYIAAAMRSGVTMPAASSASAAASSQVDFAGAARQQAEANWEANEKPAAMEKMNKAKAANTNLQYAKQPLYGYN